MCMQSNGVRPVQKWRWAGDEIVSPAIPASRKVPGSKIARFPMDVRGFLAIEHDAVVRSFLQDKIIAPLPSAVAREKFWRDGQGNFDFRIGAIKRAFQALNYLNGGRRFDAWQFPEETLVRRASRRARRAA